MNGTWAWLANLLRYEPTVAAWVANGGLAALLLALHVGATPTAAVVSVATALATIYTAVQVRPVAVPALVGALATIATAAAAFGLRLPAADVSTGVTVLSAVLALLLRQNVIPVLRLAPPPSAAPAVNPVAAAAAPPAA